MNASEDKKNQVALVLQGGGARGAFSSGVLDVFAEAGIDFPYFIGTSAGALCACNFISGDQGRNRYICTELLADPKFVSFRNLLFKRTAFNFGYLFFTVPQTIYPFNEEAFFADDRPFYAACTSMETGEAAYFNKQDMQGKEFYDALTASASLPLLSKAITVDGKKYLDGGPAASIPFKKPLEDGCEKIVVVLTRARGYRKTSNRSAEIRLAKALYRKYPAFVAKFKEASKVYNDDMEELERLEKDGKAFCIYPDNPPKIGRAEKDKEKLLALYEEGRQVATRLLPELKAFMGAGDE